MIEGTYSSHSCTHEHYKDANKGRFVVSRCNVSRCGVSRCSVSKCSVGVGIASTGGCTVEGCIFRVKGGTLSCLLQSDQPTDPVVLQSSSSPQGARRSRSSSILSAWTCVGDK